MLREHSPEQQFKPNQEMPKPENYLNWLCFGQKFFAQDSDQNLFNLFFNRENQPYTNQDFINREILKNVLRTIWTIFQLINPEKRYKTFTEIIEDYEKNPELREKLELRLIELLANQHQIRGDIETKKEKIYKAIETANETLKEIEEKYFDSLPTLHQSIDIQEIKTVSELLLTIFNQNKDRYQRFEALRTFVLSRLALGIDNRHNQEILETKNTTNQQFIDFLNKSILADAEEETVVCTAYINPENNHVVETEISIVENTDTNNEIDSNDSTTKTRKKSIIFRAKKIKLDKQSEILIFLTDRKKTISSYILKMIRNRKTDIPISRSDYNGIRIVFLAQDKKTAQVQIKDFIKKITAESLEYGKWLEIIRDKNSLTDKNNHQVSQHGSSKDLKIKKITINWGGQIIEVQFVDFESFFNNKNSHIYGHSIYEIRRLFESGALELLYPKSIYGIDLSPNCRLKKQLIDEKKQAL